MLKSAVVQNYSNPTLTVCLQWAFGVVLWELITLAQQPYSEVDPFEMAAYLRDGYRLAQPHNCPDQLLVNILITHLNITTLLIV